MSSPFNKMALARTKWHGTKTETHYDPKLPFDLKRPAFVYEKELYYRRKEWTELRKLLSIRHFLLHVISICSLALMIYLHVLLVEAMRRKKPREIVLYTLNDIDTDCAKIAMPSRDPFGVYIFHHLPYAATPAGDFRFRNPVYTKTFQECFGAFWTSRLPSQRSYVQGHVRFIPIPIDIQCSQLRYLQPVEGSETCLTLSIATPKVAQSKKNQKDLLPVVVYIGGQNAMENKQYMPSSKIITKLNMVYVTVNYRLSALGFLDFREEPYIGNQGAKDILMALEWIQTNIASFGGDKNRVTFFGDRTGATIGLSFLKRKKKERYFNNLWLFRASVLVPEAPKFPFFANDIMKATPNRCHEKHHVSNKIDCLENFDAKFLLRRTPFSWRKIDSYFCSMPKNNEKKISLILPRYKSMDPVTLVSDMVNLGEIEPLPLTLVSTLNDIPGRLLGRFRFGNMTKRQMLNEIKSKLSTFQSPGSTVNLAQEIIKVAKEVIAYVGEISKMKNRVNELEETIGFEDIINYIISDVRSAIPNNYITKFIKVNGHLLRDMYRILDTSSVGSESAFDAKGRACDVPVFLIDETHSCKLREEAAEKFFGESCKFYRQAYLKAFSGFIRHDMNDTQVKEARFPIAPKDPSLSETFNFLANAGLLPQADVRTTFLLATGDRWMIRGSERQMIEKTASVN